MEVHDHHPWARPEQKLKANSFKGDSRKITQIVEKSNAIN